MAAVKIVHHAMELIENRGVDHPLENMSVVIVESLEDFRIEHHRSETPGGASTLKIIRNKRELFQAKLERNWKRDDALISETDDSMAQQKMWASDFLEPEVEN